MNRPSVTEATTRKLGATAQPFPTEHNPLARQTGSGPSQPSRGETQTALGAQTAGLAPQSSFKRWIPGLLLVLCLATLITAYYLVRQPRIVKIITPSAPETPAVPPPPKPDIPPPAGMNSTGNIDPNLVYPGARTTRIISKAGEKELVQFESDDTVDKVAEWYKNKLNPAKIVQQPGTAVLKSDKVSVIINSNGKGTNIMVRQNEN